MKGDQARPITLEAECSAAGLRWLIRQLRADLCSSAAARAYLVLGELERRVRSVG